MGSIADLYASVRADMSQFDKELQVGLEKAGTKGAQTFGQKFSSGMKRHATLISAGVGAAVGDFIASSAQAFARFDDQMREVFSIMPGISQAAMDKMKEDVLDVSKEYGVLTDELIPALGTAIGSGIPESGVVEFMRTASKAAKAGGADVSDAVGVMAATLNAFRLPVSEAENVANDMFNAIDKGVISMSELSAGMAGVMPNAAAMGLTFKETLAPITAMTLQGTPTAIAISQVNAALIALQRTTPDMRMALKNLGFETGQAMLDALGFQGAMEALRAEADRMGVPLIRLTGRMEGANAILQLTGQNMEAANEVAGSFVDTTGKVDDAFEMMEGGIGGASRRIAAEVKAIGIQVGQEMAAFGPLFIAFGPQVGRWIGRGMGALGGIIGKHLVAPAVQVAITTAGAVAGVLYEGALFVASRFVNAAVAVIHLLGGGRALAAASAAGAKVGAAFAGATAGAGLIGAATAAVAAMAPLAIPAVIAVGVKPILDEQVESLDIGQDTKDLITGEFLKNPPPVQRSGEFRFPWEKGGLFHQEAVRSLEETTADIFRTGGALWAQGTADFSHAIAASGPMVPRTLGQSISAAFRNIASGAGEAFLGFWRDTNEAVKASIPAWQRLDEAILSVAVGGLKRLGKEAKTADQEWKKLIQTGDRNRQAIKELNKEIGVWERRYRRALRNNDSEAAAFALAQMGRLTGERDSRQEVVDLVQDQRRELNMLPKKTTTAVEAPGLDGIVDRVRTLRDVLAAAAGRYVISLFETKPEQRQHGGRVMRGTPYIVGEKRPEVFIPDRSGRIEPSVKGMGDTYNIQPHIYGLPQRAQTPREVVAELRRAARLGIVSPVRRPTWEPA